MQPPPQHAAQDADQPEDDQQQTNDDDPGRLRVAGVVEVDPQRLLEDGGQSPPMPEVGAALLALRAGEEGQMRRRCACIIGVSVRAVHSLAVSVCGSVRGTVLAQRYPAGKSAAARSRSSH